ncbi:MAG: hypothetical protein ACO1RX_08130 [Candidatus Sericytochromatia bacterium]
MTQDKKRSTDELYAQRQWSDNLSFSRKAMDESKRKTGQLDSSVVPTAPLPPPPPIGQRQRGLDTYVDEMNQEINRVSGAVGDRMDSLGNRLNSSVKDAFKPIGTSFNEVAGTAADSLKAMGTGIGKAVLHEFTTVIRTLGDKVAVKRPPGADTPAPPPVDAPQPVAAAEPPAAVVPSFQVHFGTLLEQKVFFSTIHNKSFLSERDVQTYRPGDAQQAYDWMLRGVEEIRNCAPYGQKLPTPIRGPFMNVPMYDILRQITYQDLESFLKFVRNRPQPFQQKALKLSEAFATWAHKGAPEN